MARRQWPLRGNDIEATGDSSSTVYSDLGVPRISSDSDTIASDISGATTPSPYVDEKRPKAQESRAEKYRADEGVPFLARCLMYVTQESSMVGRWMVDARVVAILGGVSMVGPSVGFVILEKLVADDLDFHSPVLVQALVHGMTAFLIEMLTSRRFGLFVRAPHPLRVAPMLPLVAIYCVGVFLSQAAHKVNSIHGTFQTIQSALPLAVMALLATIRAPQSVVASRLRRV
ncbi:hypothetical protein GGI22_003832, partial [Coemansia erecta]